MKYALIFSILFYLSCSDNAPVYHTLSTNVLPDNAGNILPSGDIEAEKDSKVEISAVAEEGYVFKEWSGNITSSENPLEFTLSFDTEITANFELKNYPLITNITGQGSITETLISQKKLPEHGSIIKLTAIPSAGWKFEHWTGDISSTSESIELTITSAITVTANFIEIKGSNEVQFPCTNGLAKNLYPCDDIDLFAHLTPEELGGYELNDIWGWKDQQTEKLYAIVGLTDGISFVDITNPNKPIVVGNLDESRLSTKRVNLNNFDNDLCNFGIGNTPRAKSMTKGSIWRDHKVFNNHLFVVSDAQDHGMQVFDLTRLREYDGEKLVFTEDAVYTEISNAHNIVINEETGFAYAVGATNMFGSALANDCNDGGLHMIDINNPKSPTFAGCYRDSEPPRRQIDSPYIHDAQCVIYNGLDNEHINSEICFSAAERSVVITDVNDKANPITLGFSANPNVQYSHQGWLTEDHRFFIMNDELDELNLGRTTKTHIFDVSDLDNPIFIDSFDHSTYAIDHNLYVKENQIFLTNYTAGLRILNFGDLSNMDLEETGFFDTQPSNNDVDFSGTWSSYPFFDNNMVIVSDISDGLFILKVN